MAMKCYGESAGILHIGPSGGFFGGGDGMCINSPIDAAAYPQSDRLYVYANISYSSPNIRTVFNDGSDNVHSFSSSDDYCWIYWDWGDYYGDVKFELRNGSSVKRTISTCIERHGCSEGEKDYPKMCSDGSIIYKEVCINDTWVSSGEECPITDPCKGILCDPSCYGVDYYNMICEGGSCVKGELIELNDPDCGYTPPPDPDPEPDQDIIELIIDNKEIAILGTITGIIVLKYV